MKIHEYQGKELLRRFDVKVPRGRVARSVAEAEEAAKELGLPVVVKAQIHAGGRGKGGGVKLARATEDVHGLVKQMIGMNLVTHQTGPEGREVRTLLIEEGLKIKQGVLSGIAARPRGFEARLHGLGRRRHGHRRGCGQNAGENFEGIH